jgi:hypothetical protein
MPGCRASRTLPWVLVRISNLYDVIAGKQISKEDLRALKKAGLEVTLM